MRTLDQEFERLVGDPGKAQAERERDVVRWRWATPGATMHRPEPLYQQRHAYAELGELIEGEPSDEGFTRYGFDEGGRIIVSLAGRRRDLLWFDPDGAWIRIATIERRDSEVIELTHAKLDNGELVASEGLEAVEGTGPVHWTRELRWYLYEDGLLTRVISVSYEPPGELWRRAQRLTYDDRGSLAMVVESWGDERVSRSVLEGDLLGALGDWEQRSQPATSVLWDARIDAHETELPPLSEVLIALPDALADALVAAAARAVERRQVGRPFLLVVMPSNSPGRVFPPRAFLVGERHRQRRRTLAQPPDHELAFPWGTADVPELSVIEHLSSGALRAMRQANAILEKYSNLTALRAMRQANTLDHAEADHSLLRRSYLQLAAELNARRWLGASEDFLAIVSLPLAPSPPSWDAVEEQVGYERAQMLRTSLRPPPGAEIQLPRGPGRLKSTDDVELLLRSRGVRDDQAAVLAPLAEWAVRLVPGPGRSHLGGLPELPDTLEWPTHEGRPLTHLAQIDLTELPDFPGRELLPDEGRLSFFFDLGDETFEPTHAGPGRRANVVYLEPDTRVARRKPSPILGRRLPAVPLSLAPRLTLPAPGPQVNEAGLDYYDLQAYDRAYHRSLTRKDAAHTEKTDHQMLGHPTPVQEDPRQFDPHRGWRLLLALHDDRRVGFDFADAGALYFLISDHALAQRAWTQAFVEAQSA